MNPPADDGRFAQDGKNLLYLNPTMLGMALLLERVMVGEIKWKIHVSWEWKEFAQAVIGSTVAPPRFRFTGTLQEGEYYGAVIGGQEAMRQAAMKKKCEVFDSVEHFLNGDSEAEENEYRDWMPDAAIRKAMSNLLDIYEVTYGGDE